MAISYIKPDIATANAANGKGFDPTHTYKAALFDVAAALDNTLASYDDATNELVGVGYTAGGKVLVASADAGTAKGWLTFANLVWSILTGTFRYIVIYDTSIAGNPPVLIVDLGADKVCVAEDYDLNFPTADATNAILRTAWL
jgi:hypothetical protein